MTRIGYDADTQRYTFQRGNEIWVGEPGSMYGGHLTRAGTLPGEFNSFTFVGKVWCG